MANPTQLETLVTVAQRLGRYPVLWTQGAGSNISVKEHGKLFIKSSGLRLDEMSITGGVSGLDLELFLSELRLLLTDVSEEQLDHQYMQIVRRHTISGPPASMETGFHAILKSGWVIHCHSLASILLGHHQNVEPAKVQLWLRANFPRITFSFVPYVSPGFKLSRAIYEAGLADVYILANHGAVLACENLTLLDEWQNLEIRFCDDFGYSELGRFLRNPDLIDKFLREEQSSSEESFPVLFPDAAVFKRKIEIWHAQVGSKSYGAVGKSERNLIEIFLAGRMLKSWQPSIRELKEIEQNVLLENPNEKFRLKQTDSRGDSK